MPPDSLEKFREFTLEMMALLVKLRMKRQSALENLNVA